MGRARSLPSDFTSSQLDVGTYGRSTTGGVFPGLQDAAYLCQKPLELPYLVFEQASDVQTGARALAPQHCDVADLRQCEPEPPASRDERQELDRLARIDAIPRGRSSRGGEDSPRFVQSQGPPAHAASLSELADQIAVHGGRIDPDVWGKVKCRHAPPTVAPDAPGCAWHEAWSGALAEGGVRARPRLILCRLLRRGERGLQRSAISS